jgi:hypothetical protein
MTVRLTHLSDLGPVSCVPPLVLVDCAREGPHTAATHLLTEVYLKERV